MSEKIEDLLDFLDVHRVKSNMEFDAFMAELSKKFQDIASAGHDQFRFSDIRQYVTMSEDEYYGEDRTVYFGKLIRSIVVLVAKKCADCEFPVRGLPAESVSQIEINHGTRGLSDYIAPADDANKNGARKFAKNVKGYDGYAVGCCCHKKDEDAHPQRGQDHPQARVCLSCPDLRSSPIGSGQKQCLSPIVSPGNPHTCSRHLTIAI